MTNKEAVLLLIQSERDKQTHSIGRVFWNRLHSFVMVDFRYISDPELFYECYSPDYTDPKRFLRDFIPAALKEMDMRRTQHKQIHAYVADVLAKVEEKAAEKEGSE